MTATESRRNWAWSIASVCLLVIAVCVMSAVVHVATT